MSPLAFALAGGGCLALLGAGAVMLVRWRAEEKEFRRRLARAAAPLAGSAAAEELAGGESVFRPVEGRSRLWWLWDTIESRYPLVDARRSFPKAIGIGIGAAAGAWVSLWFLKVPSGWWTFPATGVAGAMAAWYALSWFQARQTALFVRQFPEIVDQIVRLSGAGLPALEALAEVAEDALAPVGPILCNVRDGLLAGLDADTALRTVAERVRIPEFTMFAAVIRLQRRSGGGITAAFSNLAETLRERRKTVLKAHASTAQTRLTLLVLTLMPVLVLIAQKFTAPQSVEILFGTEQGTTLLRWGVGFVVAGLLVARSIAARGAQ